MLEFICQAFQLAISRAGIKSTLHQFTSKKIFSSGFSLALLTLGTAIALIPTHATLLLASQPQTGFLISQSNQRRDYREIPLGNISSPLTGKDPRAVAIDAFGSSEASQSQQVEINRPTSNTAVVTITQMDLEDDSVAGIKYRVELRRNGQEWQIVWSGMQTKCQTGRGHQDWGRQSCL